MTEKFFVTSDLHFGHDKEFLFRPRGFENIEDMNRAIIENWNNTVGKKDNIYVLGDLMLGDNEKGIECVNSLNGKLHIILGNHDTDVRIKLYGEKCKNVVSISYAERVRYKKYHFYLSHYPTLTANLESESLHQCIINLYGHTHQKTNFYNEIPFMYHVGLDSHNCNPVLIDDIIKDIKEKVEECKSYL